MPKLEFKHKLCYSFCSDLGNKVIYETDLDDQMNFRWSLFRVKQHYSFFGGGSVDLPNSDGVKLPGNYHIEKVEGEWNTQWKDKEYVVFLAPEDYYRDGSIYYKSSRTLYIDFPKELNEQPHMHKHSTFQLYYLKDELFSCSCQFLGCENGKIKAVVGIYASPTGTYFYLESWTMFIKWKVEVRQNIVVMNLVKDTIEAVSATGKKIAAGLAKGLSLGTVNLSGNETDAMKGLFQNLIIGKDNWAKMGLDKEKIHRVQELQTQRLFTSTSLTGEAMLEPTIFHANSITFPFNLFDYFLRSFTPHWQARIYVSENLHNNIIHNNNSNPITYPLDITFKKLGSILKPGFIQGKLVLDHDSNGKMAECFARGITFYKDKKDHFVNPKLTLASIEDRVVQTRMGADTYTAQAITEGGEGISIDIPYNSEQRGYSHTTYIILSQRAGTQQGTFTAMENFKDAVKRACGANEQALHYNSTDGFCWGCTYDELKRKGFLSMKWTAPQDCVVVLYLHAGASQGEELDLKGGTEYNVTISETQFIFKSEGKTRLVWQKQPNHDDFSALDWSPPPGSGGDIEIPLEDPEIAIPEPGEGDPSPEPDFPVDPFDPTGGEPEIPPIEPDLPADIDPGLDPNAEPDIDPPPVEPDIPDQEPDREPDRDPEGDPDLPPDPFDPDDDPDGD